MAGARGRWLAGRRRVAAGRVGHPDASLQHRPAAPVGLARDHWISSFARKPARLIPAISPRAHRPGDSDVNGALTSYVPVSRICLRLATYEVGGRRVGLTRFAGQPDYAAGAALWWWTLVASYSTGVKKVDKRGRRSAVDGHMSGVARTCWSQGCGCSDGPKTWAHDFVHGAYYRVGFTSGCGHVPADHPAPEP